MFYFSNMIYMFALKHSGRQCRSEFEKMACLSELVKFYFVLGLRHGEILL